MSNIVMCPITAFPSFVAGPVAANALHRLVRAAGFSSEATFPKSFPSSPFGSARSASSRQIISDHALIATMSVRSSGRESNFAPAAVIQQVAG